MPFGSHRATWWALPVAVAIVALLSVAVACGDDEETLVIVVQPTSTAAELTADAAEIESFLEDRLDVDVELIFPTSFAGTIEALRFGTADAAFMSAWPSALAAEAADAEVVLAEVREVTIGDEATEAPFYYSYWVVLPDSPYRGLEDLHGASVAFSSPLSTSGYVAPVGRLVELGLVEQPADGEADPEEFFGEVLFAGGYAQGWAALEAGQVDAAIIAGDVSADLYNDVLDNTRVIEEQGPVPSHGVVFSDELEDPIRGELIDALLALGQPEHRELMRKFISGIFVRFEETTTAQHLGTLQEFLDLTGLSFVEANADEQTEPDLEPEADPEP